MWLATGSLATLECLVGIGAHLAMSQLGVDPFVSIVITFFFLAFVTLMFGWWLAKDVVRPIDSLTLIAKSLERSPNAALPRTTGSAETDELLATLHRNGQQAQKLIAMMEEVAAGRTDAAAVPIESSDKLAASFQKLVSRVTDSIAAKRDLDELRDAIGTINADIAGIRNGKLDVNFRARHELMGEITDTIRYLANRTDKIVRGVRVSSAGLGSAAAEAKRVLRSVSEARDDKYAFISRGIAAAAELQLRAGAVVRGADAAIAAFGASVSAPPSGGALEGLSKAAELPSRIAESGRKIQKLRSGIAELANIGRTANEIAKRSNLIALNTPLYLEGDGEDTSLDLIVNEVSALSERAATLSREIRTLTASLSSEVSDLGTSLRTISTVSVETARGSERAGQLLNDYAQRFAELAPIRSKLGQFGAEQAAEQEKMTQISTAVATDRSDEEQIREAELQVRNLIALVEGLKDSISDFQGTGPKVLAARNGNNAAPTNHFDQATAAAFGGMEEN